MFEMVEAMDLCYVNMHCFILSSEQTGKEYFHDQSVAQNGFGVVCECYDYCDYL